MIKDKRTRNAYALAGLAIGCIFLIPILLTSDISAVGKVLVVGIVAGSLMYGWRHRDTLW